METLFKAAAAHVALGIEAAAALVIAGGAIEAVWLSLVRMAHGGIGGVIHKREIWIRFATWLLLGLEFELGADVIRSAISPTWNEIGQLAAIAAIRTFLNFFLERDIEGFTRETLSAVSPN
jgi:uncharacterized membrane protein